MGLASKASRTSLARLLSANTSPSTSDELRIDSIR
jgi:hypothetical protein